MSKYRNRKTTIDGITFDSKAEARRYAELKLLEKVGEIRDLELQPRFRLVDGFKKNGKVFRPIDYIADFKYVDREGKTIVEDVKGKETEVFKIKQKLFEMKYPGLELKIVK